MTVVTSIFYTKKTNERNATLNMNEKQQSVSIFGVQLPIKYVSLVILALQSTSMVAILRYSRVVDGPMYSISTAVIASEVFKFFISLALIYFGTVCRKILMENE